MTTPPAIPAAEGTPSTSTAPLNPARWVHDHGDVLFRYAIFRVRQHATAEELVQETFLAALSAKDGFRRQASERTWLLGILKHKLADHFRAQRPELSPSTDAVGDPLVDSAFDARGHWQRYPKRWHVDAPALLEKEEFWQVFHSCVAALPESMAHAFALRVLDNTASGEVCQLLNITPTNLWMLLHRARSRLRLCLETKWFTHAPESES